jgi:membrane protein
VSSKSLLAASSGTKIFFVLSLAVFGWIAIAPRAVSKTLAASQDDGEDGRGRDASVPEKIPLKGLRDVFWRVVHEVREDRVTLIAAGVTFYLLLALFPGLAALVAIYGLVADPATMAEHLRELSGLLPPGAFDLIAERITSLVEARSSTLGLTFFIGLAVAIWSSHGATLAVFDAMNVAYEETEKRSFIRLNVLALGFTLCSMVAGATMIGLVAVMPVVVSYLWLDQFKENLALVLRWPFLLFVTAAAATAVYRFGPSREPAKLRWLTWGAALVTILWSAMSLGFSFYLDHFANYDATYGTLGALIGLLMWAWLSIVILIIGGELNAELEHQTAKDTTTGQPLPLGLRGAYVADTIGVASD